MGKSQKLITDFYKVKRQRLITDFFQPWPNPKSKFCFYQPKRDYGDSRRFLMKHRRFYDAAITKGGYFYCASSNFSEYGVYLTSDRILIKNNQMTKIAKGSKIATAIVDADSALEHISVEKQFRRQGIGKQLIRFINKHDSQFHVYSGTEYNSRYRLTGEGAALIRSCQKAGILDDEQVILGVVPDSPSNTNW